MSTHKFHRATVEEMQNGLVRIKGNVENFNFILYISMAVGVFAAFTFGFIESGSTMDRFVVGIGVFVFFTGFGFCCRFIFIPAIFRLSRGKNFYKLWWNDFTYDGKMVVSGKVRIDASEIAYVKPVREKFSSDTDDWFYAQIMKGNGVEIGRVMVVSNDLADMVEYLSDLFAVPVDDEGLQKFLDKNGMRESNEQEYIIGPEEDRMWTRMFVITVLITSALFIGIHYAIFSVVNPMAIFTILMLNIAIVHNIWDNLHTKAVKKAMAAEKEAKKKSKAHP